MYKEVAKTTENHMLQEGWVEFGLLVHMGWQ